MNPRPLPSDFLPLTAARRQRIEATIEALIAMLDELDGDSDLEPGLGWTARGNQDSAQFLAGILDIEDENEDGGDALDTPGGPEWSSDPDVPQEGHGWHFHDSGGAVDRNSIGASA